MEKKSYEGGAAGLILLAFLVAVFLCAAVLPFVYTAWLR